MARAILCHGCQTVHDPMLSCEVAARLAGPKALAPEVATILKRVAEQKVKRAVYMRGYRKKHAKKAKKA